MHASFTSIISYVLMMTNYIIGMYILMPVGSPTLGVTPNLGHFTQLRFLFQQPQFRPFFTIKVVYCAPNDVLNHLTITHFCPKIVFIFAKISQKHPNIRFYCLRIKFSFNSRILCVQRCTAHGYMTLLSRDGKSVTSLQNQPKSEKQPNFRFWDLKLKFHNKTRILCIP